jgi:hypothetical protein
MLTGLPIGYNNWQVDVGLRNEAKAKRDMRGVEE